MEKFIPVVVIKELAETDKILTALKNNGKIASIVDRKGKQNKAPIAKYMPAVQAFIKQNKFKLGGDKRNTGLIEQDGEYYNLFHLPQNFVLRDDLDLSNMDLTELPDMSTEASFNHWRNDALDSLEIKEPDIYENIMVSYKLPTWNGVEVRHN